MNQVRKRVQSQIGDDSRKLSLIVDYLFGKGVSRSLPKGGFRLYYSRKSGRVKLVHHERKIFATVKPTGAMALSVYGATLLAESARFRDNCVVVSDDAVQFVRGGRSVFNKFVVSAGKNIYPKSEVAILDRKGKVVGVGMAVLNGVHMGHFKTGVAVKVRAGLVK